MASTTKTVTATTTAKIAKPAGGVVTPTFRIEDLLALLREATPETCADLLEALNRGMEIYNARHPVVVDEAPKRRPGRPKKVVAEITLPAVGEDGVPPDAAAYRMADTDTDTSCCVARVLLPQGKDKRYRPAVYVETQCRGKLKEGCELCEKHQGQVDLFVETDKHGAWNGMVTEEPPAWCHMLGTTWAEKTKWVGDGDSGSETGSETVTARAAKLTPEEKEAKAAEKAAKAETKAAEKAAKEAAKAEKEAAKEKAKAAKEAAAAAKEAAKAAKEAAKVAAAKTAKPKKGAKATEEAKADTAAPAPETEGSLEYIDGTMYMVKGKNAYEYDEGTETAGAYAGQMREDGTLDTEAAEVTA
jgi:chemotaxis protein histidine kinase CheA